MVSEIINVGVMMRKNAFVQKGKCNEKVRVSPDAVKEYIGRIHDHIETNMPLICDIARNHKRNTVFDDDITEFFSLKYRTVAGDEVNE